MNYQSKPRKMSLVNLIPKYTVFTLRWLSLSDEILSECLREFLAKSPKVLAKNANLITSHRKYQVERILEIISRAYSLFFYMKSKPKLKRHKG